MAEMRPLAIYPTDAVPVREMKSGDVLPVELLATALSLQLTGLNKTDPAVITAVDTILGALGKLQAQASNKVDKDGAKVLSDNNFTNAAMVKLANIAEQATKNASDADLRDRTTHTGAQAIGTVSGLQAALDAKETPAGALLQMQQFGLGATVAAITPSAQTLRTGGMYQISVAASAEAGLPLATMGHNILHVVGNSGANAHQFASPITSGAANVNRLWHRQLSVAGWSPWQELAYLDSPALTGNPTAPTAAATDRSGRVQTTAGSLSQMRSFGLGQERFGDVTAGYPKVLPSSIGNTAPTTFIVAESNDLISTSGKPVEDVEFAGVSVSRLLRPVQFGVSGRGAWAQFWYRGYSAALATQGDWLRLAEIDSPAFTGTPSVPNLKIRNAASADANTLDYYEEGTFNPSIEGTATVGAPTYSARFGRYTRIGNRVFWTCRLTLTALGDMAGSVRLGGFPFITANTGGAEGSISVGFYQGLASGAEVSGMTGLHRAAANNANLYRISTVSKNTQALVVADISNNLSLYASGQYEV